MQEGDMNQKLIIILFVCMVSTAWAGESITFGSYGRVGISSDVDGGRGDTVQINQYGPRLTEGNYLELDFGSAPMKSKYGVAKVLTTLAFDDALFHYDGQWRSNLAVRRFQLSLEELWRTKFFVVLGSQWNRGDDIYLMNFWPLDDVNSNGLTVGYAADGTEAKLHLGVSRLENNRQQQSVEVSGLGFDASDAVILDRQRFISTMSIEHRLRGADQKLKLYAEYHYLPSGELQSDTDARFREQLADDLGFLIGAQYGIWGFGSDSHLNVFLRYAKGLAVFDELASATSVNRDRRAVDAQEGRVAISANFQSQRLSLMVGGYARYFDDGDVNSEDFDDRQEAALAIRPMLRIGAFTPAVEASIQLSRPNGLNPQTGVQEVAQVLQLAAIPALTIGKEPGAYTRPQIRAIVAVSFLNDAALNYYPKNDPRHQEDSVWFFGAMAEWWFGRGGGY